MLQMACACCQHCAAAEYEARVTGRVSFSRAGGRCLMQCRCCSGKKRRMATDVSSLVHAGGGLCPAPEQVRNEVLQPCAILVALRALEDDPVIGRELLQAQAATQALSVTMLPFIAAAMGMRQSPHVPVLTMQSTQGGFGHSDACHIRPEISLRPVKQSRCLAGCPIGPQWQGGRVHMHARTWSMAKPRQPPLRPALLRLPGRGIHTVCQVGGS